MFIPFLFCISIIRQAFVNHLCWPGTEIKPSISHWRNQDLSETGLIITQWLHDWSLCSVIYNGLALKPCSAGTIMTIKVYHSRGSVCCIWSCCGGLCAFCDNLGSDAGLVAVEGRDVKHVAVRAHSDRLHLAISGQWCRVGGATRAEDLEWQHV